MSALTRPLLMLCAALFSTGSALAQTQPAQDRLPVKAQEKPQDKATTDKPPARTTNKTTTDKAAEKNRDKSAAGPPAPEKPTVVAKLVVGDPLAPDDYALRYYASQKQKARVNAELARLKKLYPNYEPPANLYEQPGNAGPDEEALWALYSADKLEDLQAAIAQRKKETPDWKPSADLDKKVRHKSLRQKIAGFFKAEKFQDLVDYVKGENVDLAELADDVDILWSIGEAYARAKQNEDAITTYKRVLTSAKDGNIRIATIQKAMAAMRMVDVEALLASVEGGSEVTGEYESLKIDITRARIAAWLHDERARRPTADDLLKFEVFARDSRDASQLGLVAWYHYKRHDIPGAFEWFKLAIQNNGDATIAHGLAHSLRSLGRQREAEEVAYAWREPLANNNILFVDLLGAELMREVPPYIEPDRLARFAKVVVDTASGEGAQALGWYAFSSCQFDVALPWFERAVALYPRESAVTGYVLTLRKLKKGREFYELANRYDGLFANVISQVFPDDLYHPPTPCDAKEASRYHGTALRTGVYVVPGPATIPGAAANYDPAAILPKPAAQTIEMNTPIELQLQRVMKTIKGKFPAAVNPANPLRFHAPSFGMPVVYESPLAMDPVRTPPPLVARRVPGVGAMPYERFGFNLLPGWNGVEMASSPTYQQQQPLAGTPAAEAVDLSKAGIAAFDARFPAAARGLPSMPYPAAGPPPIAPSAAAPAPQMAVPAPTTPSSNYAPRRGPAYGQYPQPASR